MKRIRTTTTACLAGLLLLAPAALRAEMASGSCDVPVDATLKLWDISGTYHEDLDGVTMDYTVNVDAAGKISGTGTASMSDGVDTLTATFTGTGTMRSAGSAVRVNMTLKMSGSGYVSGYYATFKANVNEKLELDTTNHLMVGTASGSLSVRVPGLGGRSIRLPPAESVTDLPEDMNGSLGLALNVTTNRTRYAGTGTLSLSNGKDIALGATGSYQARTDKSTLTLKGVGLDRALSLNLATTCTNAQLCVQSLKGKALGQTLRFAPAAH
jgi:hypothetical protein